MVRLIQRLWSRPAKPAPAHLRLGAWGERVAVRSLRRKGWRILGKGVRFGRKHEIDIVARDGDTLVFVEVKTRRDEQFARPLSAVGRDKRRMLSEAAMRYLRRLRTRPAYIRFDVVEVIGQMDEPHPQIRHIPNAFPLDRRYTLHS
jgi:putative endonuclease